MNEINLTKSFGIYQIKNLDNKQIYVGSTVRSFYKRWADWRCNFKRGKANRHLQNAWNKYGAESFEYSILEIVQDKKLILEREQYWIDLLKPEYNFDKKAQSGRLGTPTNEETRQKISTSTKGKVKTEEWRRNLSLVKKGIPTGPSPKKGKSFVEHFCKCGKLCARYTDKNGTPRWRKTCGSKECHIYGGRKGQRQLKPCPVCENPRKECYLSSGEFSKYQKTCGDQMCITELQMAGRK